ncbi:MULTISPECIES: hypothetical protein [unclassified Legionella]|uniref:hypothetical protein n=1 Tax=unclassified Legionella TaxID=2622702 RepID=UPI001055855B|nr:MULTISPECIES: hypothetical protein [unclassified Legionella]MDI9819232.1 hypothetical protein [Legionella sp. PL877]
MSYYDNKKDELKRNYHSTKINSNPRIIAKINVLLKNLNIPEKTWTNYHDLTIYDCLQTLKSQGHSQIDYILELIEEKAAADKFNFILGGTLAITVVSFLLTLPAFSTILALLEGFLMSVTGLPILGLIYTVGSAIYYFQDNQFDKKRTLFNRLRDNSFLLANTALNVTAYGLWISAALPMTPLVGALFIIASTVDVVKEIFSLAQLAYRYFYPPLLNESEPLIVHQNHARNVYGLKQHRNALLINLAASILLVGIMATWCFAPGGIFLAIAAIAAIGIVYGVKSRLLKYNASRIRERLQNELATLETSYSSPCEVTVSNEPSESPVTSQTLCQTSNKKDFRHKKTVPAAERPFFRNSNDVGKTAITLDSAFQPD